MANSYNQELIQALRIFNRGDYHEARRKFTQLVSVKDKDPQIRLWLGAACFEVGYFEDARTHWQQSLELTNDPKLINLIHTSLAELEQVEAQFKQINSHSDSTIAEPSEPIEPVPVSAAAVSEIASAPPAPEVVAPNVAEAAAEIAPAIPTTAPNTIAEVGGESLTSKQFLSEQDLAEHLASENLLSEDIPDDIAFEDIFPEFADADNDRDMAEFGELNHLEALEIESLATEATVARIETQADLPTELVPTETELVPTEPESATPSNTLQANHAENYFVPEDISVPNFEAEDWQAENLEENLEIEDPGSENLEATHLEVGSLEVDSLEVDHVAVGNFDVGGEETDNLAGETLENESWGTDNFESWEFGSEDISAENISVADMSGEEPHTEAPAAGGAEASSLTTQDLEFEINALMTSLDQDLHQDLDQEQHNLIPETQDSQNEPTLEAVNWEDSAWEGDAWEGDSWEALAAENLGSLEPEISSTNPANASGLRAKSNASEVEAEEVALPYPKPRRSRQASPSLPSSSKRGGIGAGIRAAFWGICISLVSVGMTGAATYVITQESLQRQVQQVQQGQVINPLEESTYLNRRLLLGLLVVATGSTLVAVVITWLANRRSKYLLQHAIQSTQRIAFGDFSTRVLIQGDDDIGQLGESLNQMVVCLQTLFDELSHLKALDHTATSATNAVVNLAAEGLSLDAAPASTLRPKAVPSEHLPFGHLQADPLPAENLQLEDSQELTTNSDKLVFDGLEELLGPTTPAHPSVSAESSEQGDTGDTVPESPEWLLSADTETADMPAWLKAAMESHQDSDINLDSVESGVVASTEPLGTLSEAPLEQGLEQWLEQEPEQDLMEMETIGLNLIDVEPNNPEANISESGVPELVGTGSSSPDTTGRASVSINLGRDPFESLLMEMGLVAAEVEPPHLPESQQAVPTSAANQELPLQALATPQVEYPQIQQPQPPVADRSVLQTALAQLQLIHESVTNLTLQTKQQHHHTEQARQLLASGDATIARTVDEFESLQTAVSAVNKRLNSLNLLSQQGSSVMDVIHQFAERSSQLAINTAIASERSATSVSQSGFSNLSGQVRSLAADAELITEEVKQLVKALQSDLPQVSHVLAAGTERLQSNWQQVKLSRSQLHQIIDTLTPGEQAVETAVVTPTSHFHDANPATPAATDPVTQLTTMVEDLQARVAELRSNLVSVGAKV